MNNPLLKYLSRSESETYEFGRELGKHLEPGDIIGLTGELGSGKTILIKGICDEMEVKQNVTSSSFILHREFQGRYRINHFDFYRLSAADEIIDTGCEEILYSDGISLIEWFERLKGIIDAEHLHIHLDYSDKNENLRNVLLTAKGPRYENLINLINIKLERIY